ncbi:MAG: hypothetical protein GY940_14480, partial [bacterium]|nr:hypothetical protein [bacterium]
MKEEKNKQYWFYIDSYVHISVKKDWILFYNPYNGEILEYRDTPEITRLIKKLLRPRNLRVVRLSETDLERPVIRELVESVRKYFLGDLIDVIHSQGKPAQMPPMAKIQKDVDHLKEDSMRSVGEDMMDYLSDLWLYVNDRCHRGCDVCEHAFRQFGFCTARQQGNRELSLASIHRLFDEMQSTSSVNLHILGGNILEHSQLDRLLEILEPHGAKYFYLHYLNVAGREEKLRQLSKYGGRLKVPVTFPVDQKQMEKALESISGAGIEFTLLFALRSVEEFQQADEFGSGFPPENVAFHPL